MYCKRCGTQLPDDAAVCTRCGAQQRLPSAAQPETLVSPAFSTQEFNAVTAPADPPPKRKGRRAPLLLPLALIGCIGLAILAESRLPADGALPLYMGEAVSAPEAPETEDPPESTPPAEDPAPADSELPAEDSSMPSAWGDMPAESTPPPAAPELIAPDDRYAALAEGLSPDGVTAAPHTDPVLSAAGAAPLTKATVYTVAVDTPMLRLRAQPNTSAEVLDQLWNTGSRFYGLLEQDGWIYGVYLGQTGWCAAEYLTPADEQVLPDFLTAGEQCRYLQALSLYNGCTIGGSPGRNHADTREINGLQYCSSRSFLGSYDRLCAVLGDVFLSRAAVDIFLTGGFYPVEDALYEVNADGGSILAILLQSTAFRLDGRSEDRLVFTQLATYKDDYDGHLYTMEWPVVFVRDTDGVWRCEMITSAVYGDLLAE